MGRTAARSRFDHGVRLQLVEEDVDGLEGDLKAGIGELRGELAKIKGVLLGILVSVATASILLAINLVVTNGA